MSLHREKGNEESAHPGPSALLRLPPATLHSPTANHLPLLVAVGGRWQRTADRGGNPPARCRCCWQIRCWTLLASKPEYRLIGTQKSASMRMLLACQWGMTRTRKKFEKKTGCFYLAFRTLRNAYSLSTTFSTTLSTTLSNYLVEATLHDTVPQVLCVLFVFRYSSF